jgi:Flp pilus assembly protein TadB
MAVTGERTAAMREDARERLEGVVKERPGVRPFLELRPLAMAVGIAAVLTLVVSLLFSVTIGAVVLVLSFALAWVVLSKRSYEERRPTRDPEDGESSPGKKQSEVAPFSS